MLCDSIMLLTLTEGATVAELIYAREVFEVPAGRLGAASLTRTSEPPARQLLRFRDIATRNREVLVRLLAEVFRARPTCYWLSRTSAAGIPPAR